jgi:hypothetical protein
MAISMLHRRQSSLPRPVLDPPNPPRIQVIPFDKAVAMITMQSFHAMLIPILTGMILLAIGFNFRDKNAGVFAMWIGMLTILGTVVFKILAKLNE